MSERTNKPSRTRTYIVNCTCCFQWVPVLSREVQDICREAGVCPDCVRDDYYMLRIRIAAIEQRMINIAKLGKSTPEDERGALRELYGRKARQLAESRTRIEQMRSGMEES